MALTDKNILITPNIGATDDPKIVFSGADASTTAQNITLRAYPTSNGTLSFEGSAGQLFSITNSLTGTIYSVNDISGIPSIEVLDTGLVKLAQYAGNVLVGTGVDNSTDKLQINGSLFANTVRGSTLVSTVAAGTPPLTVTSNTTVTNFSADLLDGLHVHAARNNEANKVVRTDGSGYIQAGYINSSNGDENNASSPPRVWGTNGSDNYLRTYQTAYVSVGYATNLSGGVAGGVPYQTGASASAITAAGTAGQVLTSNGAAAPYWSTPSVSSMTITDDVATSSTVYPAWVGGASGSQALKVSSTKISFVPSTGNLTAAGSITAYSDERIKTDITPIDNAVAKVQSLDGVTYTRTDSGERQTGLIAQAVQKVLPEAVLEGPEGLLSLAYGNMVGLLVQAIKEQQLQIDALKAEIHDIKAKA